MLRIGLLLCLAANVSCHLPGARLAFALPDASSRQPDTPSLAAQVGQMLLVGFSGTSADDLGVQQARQAAEAGELGGLILHRYNIVSPAQLTALVAHVRSWQVATPLLICINQEGGQAQRLRPEQGFVAYPSAWQMAQQPASEVQERYTQMAQELKQLDIDVNFAPVVDLHDPASAAIGARERSFSASPAEVTRLAGIFMAAHKAAGVHTVLKHFVGHGAAVGDTHRGFADVTEHDLSDALQPFAQLIAQGGASAVMTAHLTHRALEPSGEPMTFSRTVVEEHLRSHLGFDGVVISDDLQMGALTQHYALEDILEKTVAAGHDVLLFSQNQAADGISPAAFRAIPHLHAQTVAAMRRAIAKGVLSPGQIAQHHARVLRFKAQRNVQLSEQPPRL